MHGWAGWILRVDLEKTEIERRALDPRTARDFLGGRGLNSLVLFNEISPQIDPLGPENVYCLGAGPLSGTPLGLTGRVEVSTLSPYSGILGDGNAGGSMAFMMKRAGLDQIVISGVADSPCYLLVENNKAELLDAEELWGLSVWESTDRLRERHGKSASVACIGLAGENLVRMATTMIDKYASAARGSGAVLGSKKIKAIVVKGSGRISLADENAFRKMAAEDREFFRNSDFQREVVGQYGTHIGMMMWEPGFRNYKEFWKAEDVPDELRPESWKRFSLGRHGCHGCHVRCKDHYRIPSGKRAGESGKAMEYECIFCLGTNCGITDPVAIMEMENICDIYGMDVLALGNTIAMLKDLYNRGLLEGELTDGLDLSWQNHADQIELLHRTAQRQGLGNLVAEGMYTLAKRLGGQAMDYCYHVKGLSRGPYPSGIFSLAHATSTRGADHLRGRSWAFSQPDPDMFPILNEQGLLQENPDENPAPAVITGERMTTLADCIGRCKGAVNNWISAVPLVWKKPIFEGLAELLSAATGIGYTTEKLEQAADRVYALEHAFNIRQGISRKDDCMPQKPDIRDTAEGRADLEKHEEHLSRYYELRGYDRQGRPTPKRLTELGLAFVDQVLNADNGYKQWDGPPMWKLENYPHGGNRS
ncbi:aldehyde ferredoxin oxidoreductase family protein [Maridesulfovibrio sp.]|uniref:aldehyde ferredoxin oxidoreductase family protein n=1 Tax=Maridesulfovibrio sp. TaxID=2795000 RepID=UPI0029CA7421|nr:aldehyde ferredoxin oxidoreductase family protein [Maridesulfovibrio sp.]